MKSRRKRCLRPDGTLKAVFATRERCWDEIHKLEGQNRIVPDSMKAFECEDCGKYHMGRPQRRLDILRQENARRRNVKWT